MNPKGTPQKWSLTIKKLGPRPYVLAIGAVIFLLIIFMSLNISLVEDVNTISIVALFAGLMFETIILSDKIIAAFYVLSYALIISSVLFVPGFINGGAGLRYCFQIWPFVFLASYIIFLIAIFENKIQPKLTEGMTLLLSITIAYWSFDNHIIFTSNVYLKAVLIIGLLFSLFSIYNAFTRAPLYAENRFVLSLWCSIIIFIFSVENINNMLLDEEQSTFYNAFQYFTLGISSIYTFQNILMLIRFLPSKEGELLSEEFADQVAEASDTFIHRFSDKHVNIKE